MKPLALIFALSGFLAVAIGAFGAHALQARLDDHLLKVFYTGAQYQFYHTLALGLCVLFLRQEPASVWLLRAGWAFVIGMMLFSGSLYALAITGISQLGIITPLGGLSFLAGWVMFGLGLR
jgi:uncharacterized membrane protein YgdD (TMEM256/DUF423 family)